MDPSRSNVKEQVLNDLDGGYGSKLPPKRRTRFTYSADSTISPQQDPSSSKQSNISATSSRSSEHVYLPSLTSLQRRRAFHNSIEDVHQNHRQMTSRERYNREELDKRSSGTDDSYLSIDESIEEGNETEDDDDEKNNIFKQGITHDDNHEDEHLEIDPLTPEVILLEENILLKNGIENERKQVLKRKVACGFAFEAMRRQRSNVIKMEGALERKKEEVAARIILHHLLLNSWRLKSGELSSVMHENAQLHKTIDNLCLQLRVVRHLQSTEKEKSVTRNKEFETSTTELRDIRIQNQKIRFELEKVSLERNGLKTTVEELKKTNDKISTELKSLAERKDIMIRGSELNKIRAEKFQKENKDLNKEVTELRGQVKSLTKQSSHWQEKARAFESECWELKVQIDSRDETLLNLKKDKEALSKEYDILTLSKKKTEDLLKESKEDLNKSLDDKDKAQKELQTCQSQLKEVGGQVGNLGLSLNRLKTENNDLRNNLYDYSLKNVRKRRVWGRALYFIFNPIGLLKSFYFGGNDHPRRPQDFGHFETLGNPQLHVFKQE